MDININKIILNFALDLKLNLSDTEKVKEESYLFLNYDLSFSALEILIISLNGPMKLKKNFLDKIKEIFNYNIKYISSNFNNKLETNELVLYQVQKELELEYSIKDIYGKIDLNYLKKFESINIEKILKICQSIEKEFKIIVYFEGSNVSIKKRPNGDMTIWMKLKSKINLIEPLKYNEIVEFIKKDGIIKSIKDKINSNDIIINKNMTIDDFQFI